MACHLLKYCDFQTDIGAGLFELRYLKNKQKNEIGFIILRDGNPWLLVEVKLTGVVPSKNWKILLKQLPIKVGVQVVKQAGVFALHEIDDLKILVISAHIFFGYLV